MDEQQIQAVMGILGISREEAIQYLQSQQNNASGDGVYFGKKQIQKTYKDPRPGGKAKPVIANETVDDVKSSGEVIAEYLGNTPEAEALRTQFRTKLAQTGIVNVGLEKESAMWADLVKQSAKQYAAGYEQTPWDLFDLLGEGRGATDQTSQKNNLANLVRQIQRTAIDYGVQLNDKQITSLANRAIKENWDSASLGEFIAKEGKATDGAGKVGTTVSALRETAGNYGMFYSDDWYRNAAKGIFEGSGSEDTYLNIIKEDAKSRYTAFAPRIDAGLNMRQAVAPYITSYSQILEVPSDAVDLNDPYFTRALTSVDKDGNPSPSSIYQFEYDLRQDPRWRKTNNAREAMEVAKRQVLQDFGKVPA
jgi:hypothetical protein